MIDIYEKIVSVVSDDITMNSLVGKTESDNRIYYWRPNSDIVYNSTSPGAIIYRDSMGRRNVLWSYPSEMPPIFLFFRACSISQENSFKIAERLIDLFDKTSFSIDNWSVKWIELVSKAPGIPEGTPSKLIYTVNVSFNFAFVFRRS